MADKPDALKPARYIGEHPVELGGGPYQNIDGTRKRDNSLSYGDTIMTPAEEIYGKTLWHDPHGQLTSKFVGLGKAFMDKEHLNMSDQELGQFGYEFHKPRSDFLPLEALVSEPATPTEQPEQAFIVPPERVEDVPEQPAQQAEGEDN